MSIQKMWWHWVQLQQDLSRESWERQHNALSSNSNIKPEDLKTLTFKPPYKTKEPLW